MVVKNNVRSLTLSELAVEAKQCLLYTYRQKIKLGPISRIKLFQSFKYISMCTRVLWMWYDVFMVVKPHPFFKKFIKKIRGYDP